MPENKLELYAYCKLDGVRTMSDSYVENLYLRAEEEGLTDMVFMDGSLNDPVLFLEDMKHKSYLFVISHNEVVAGFIWLNHVQHKTAYAHFCLFRDFWGTRVKEIERFGLETLLNLQDGSNYMFDMLLAHLPKKNIAACRRVSQSCMTVMGDLPYGYFDAAAGKSIPSMLAYATRDSLEAYHG